MSEFGTSATIDVSISSSSLRQARDTIESELGNAQVDVSSATGDSGGSRIAGRERAMSRQLLSTQNERLSEIGDYGDDNLELNRERNDLLRELVDVNEKSARTTRGMGGMGGGLMMGAAGLAAGGVALGSAVLSDLLDAEPVDEFIEGTKDAAEIITGTVSVSSLTDSSVDIADTVTGTVSAASVVTGTVGATTLIEGTQAASELISGDVNIVDYVTGAVTASSIVEGTISAASIITENDITEFLTGTSVASLLTDNPAGDVLTSVSIASLIDKVPLSDLIETPSGDGGGDSGSDGGIDPRSIIGGAGAGAAAWGATQLGRGSGAIRSIIGGAAGRAGAGTVASRGVSTTTPVITPGMFSDEYEGLEGTIFDENHPIRQRVDGARDPDFEPVTGETRTDMQKPDPEAAGLEVDEDVSVENHYHVDDLRDLEREHRNAEDDIRSELEDLRRKVTGR